MKAILFSLVCSFMLAAGQICWKLALSQHKIAWSFTRVWILALNPLFLAGVALYGLATIFWIYLLSKYELSYIYPMIAFAYVFGVILAHIILKEEVSAVRIAGVVLVFLGVALIGMHK